ncbi:MAG: M14 family metallocarboxypeptidase [Rubrivivax sp.]|nr:M14 family metallocarboxypeptidase [Rubrivivax sp.]
MPAAPAGSVPAWRRFSQEPARASTRRLVASPVSSFQGLWPLMLSALWGCAPLPAPTTAPAGPAAPSTAPAVAVHADRLASSAPAEAAAPAVPSPMAPPYAEAVAARFPPPPVQYATPGLAPGRATYTSNDELAQAMRALAAREGGPRLVAAGRSHEDLPIDALHFARAAPRGAGAAAAAGRPRVLVIGQQHGDEPAGAEAVLAVAHQLAPGGELAPLLERIEVVLLPRANPDGAARAQRVGRHGSDINRDHLLLRTPEARAVAVLVREFDPVVVVDAHEHTVVGRYLEKFGAVQRNDLLLQYATTANMPPELAHASEAWFRQPLLAALAREGLTSEWYYTNALVPGDLRLAMGGVQPDTARNVYGLRNAVSFLLETRGVGIGRAHLARRVHTHVVAMRALLAAAAARADDLLALRTRAGAEVVAAACRGEAVVLAAQTATTREVVMLDPHTGADKPIRAEWMSSLELRPLRTRPRPCGYWLAPEADDAVARLQAIGVRVVRLAEPLRLRAEQWQEVTSVEAQRPDVLGRVSERQTARLVQVTLAPRERVAAPGSWYVPMDQPLANLVFSALEPDSPNSYFANRLLPGLDSAARVLVAPWR